MITEDYVSFEIAKLLKEKGFDEPIYACYKDGIFTITDVLCKYESDDLCRWGDNEYAAPTLQMAMKWLREVHNIFITIDYVVPNKSFYEYTYEIHNMRKGRSMAVSAFRDDYETYEEAVEAAIKYCLTNLIK